MMEFSKMCEKLVNHELAAILLKIAKDMADIREMLTQQQEERYRALLSEASIVKRSREKLK